LARRKAARYARDRCDDERTTDDMKVWIGAAALCVMLAAAPAFAQAPAAQAPAAPAAPAPQAPTAPPTPAAPRPFPAGTKYAFINIQRIAAESAEGKALAGRVQTLNQQKVNELNEKNKQLQAAQQKLEAGASVLSPTAAAQLQKEVERLQVDIQRFTEDAQQEVTQLQTQLQEEFQMKLSPVVQQVATEKGLHLLFSAADAGIVWADLSLDITGEIIQRFDAAAKTAGTAAPKPAPAPAAAPPAAGAPAAPAPKPAPAPGPAPKPAPPAPKPANP
jgi:outer membrane protein